MQYSLQRPIIFCRRHNTIEYLRIDRGVRRVGAHPLWPLSRQGLDPIKLAYNKPVCQQFWQQGRLLRRTRRFFPSGNRNHRLCSLHLPTEGWRGWVGHTGMVHTPNVVTNPSTNRDRRSLILVLWPTPLPVLRETSQSKYQRKMSRNLIFGFPSSDDRWRASVQLVASRWAPVVTTCRRTTNVARTRSLSTRRTSFYKFTCYCSKH